MSFLPLNTMLGKLRIVEVLDWYDGPRLFIAENASGSRYIAFWADEQEGESLWLYSLVSEIRISNLVSGKADLRSIYTDPEDEVIFLVRLTDQEQSFVDAIVPDQIEQDLLPPCDDFLVSNESFFPENDFVDSEVSEPLTHQITINRPRSNATIAFESLASVAANWSRLIHSILSTPPVPINASVGSLIIELQTEAGAKLYDFFNNLRTLIASPNPEQIVETFSHQDSKLLELFLESLHKDKLTLSAKITSQSENHSLVISHSAIRELRLKLADLNQQRVESAEVPQADDLNKLFRMLELIKEGDTNLGYHLSLSPRQVNYYKQAGRILDLLNKSNVLTSRGQYLAGLSEIDRYDVTMLFFESSPVGFAWLRYCGVYSALDLSPESAEPFLKTQCSDLAEATVGRRAQTLRYWVKAFQSQEDRD
ncbi:MAG: hypothetical protein KME14_25460 [Tildeniella torsiva UHER 1998/13D]|jgi:hypothetical protein|nr:hypothetical protein [Tildeniella torsiva UHER 1998/13D]